MDKRIMTFHISVDPSKISTMMHPDGEVTIIPFGGEVHAELFTGTILPGGVDVQVVAPDGQRHMCAKYLFKGIDSSGKECHLYVDNQAFISKGNEEGTVVHAHPRFITDSLVLRDYLMQDRFRSEVETVNGELEIRIIDTLQ